MALFHVALPHDYNPEYTLCHPEASVHGRAATVYTQLQNLLANKHAATSISMQLDRKQNKGCCMCAVNS